MYRDLYLGVLYDRMVSCHWIELIVNFDVPFCPTRFETHDVSNLLMCKTASPSLNIAWKSPIGANRKCKKNRKLMVGFAWLHFDSIEGSIHIKHLSEVRRGYVGTNFMVSLV